MLGIACLFFSDLDENISQRANGHPTRNNILGNLLLRFPETPTPIMVALQVLSVIFFRGLASYLHLLGSLQDQLIHISVEHDTVQILLGR